MSDISKIDELIAIARELPSKEENDFEDPNITIINSFINARGIEASNSLVPAKIIYDQFKIFTSTKIARNLFFQIFNRMFNGKRVLGITCSLITPVSVGLPPNYSVYKDPRFNKKTKKLKESKYIGVYPDPSGGFLARIRTEHGFKLIGHYYDEKQAAREYDKTAKLVLGTQAILNFDKS